MRCINTYIRSGFKFAELEISECYAFSSIDYSNSILSLSELVLSVLLEKFVFSPGSKEIYWNMTGINTPVVKGVDDLSPQLPLNVAFVKA
jgi:hypothetical protein